MQFQARVCPGPVRTKQQFMRSGSADGLYNVVKSSYCRGICEYIRIPRKLIRDHLVGLPIIRKAPEMGNDKIHAREFRCQHIDHFSTAGDIDEDRQAKCSRGDADLAGGHRLRPMYFNATEVMSSDSSLHHGKDSPCIADGMNKSESNQTAFMERDQLCRLLVGFAVISMQRRHHNRSGNSRGARTSQVLVQTRMRIPGSGHLVSLAGVAMAVDDHGELLAQASGTAHGAEPPRMPATRDWNQILVWIEREKVGRCRLSFGP